MDNWLIRFGTKSAQNYKGILMRANPKLHDESYDLLSKCLKVGNSVVDVGAGQGAFSLRMNDAGYQVLAVDVDKNDFKATGVSHRVVDFNSQDSLEKFKSEYMATFDASIGMEVIEHVEDPWKYIQLLKDLTKPGGIIFLTTPNIESVYSKLEFLFTTKFMHFSKADYYSSGHINPLTEMELRIIAEAKNLEVISLTALCRLPKIWITRNFPYFAYSLFNLLFGWTLGQNANGDILCLIARKPLQADV